jgi:hypothetical protein
MPRIFRAATLGVLVVALLAVLISCAGPGRTPAALVGRWKGGTHTNGPWFYEFSADGGYRTWPEQGGPVNSGMILVAGNDLTFSNGGAPITVHWSTADGQLLLDGDRYVRA